MFCKQVRCCAREVFGHTNPMIKTIPKGSFLHLGRSMDCVRGMSGMDSSLAHSSNLLLTKMQSLVHQSSSRPAS